jgi:hypothetical protein
MILEDFLDLSQVLRNSGLGRIFDKFNNCNTLCRLFRAVSKIESNFLGVTPPFKPTSQV